LRKDANQGRAQPAELILLDEFVKVDAEQLECQAQMLPVNESIFESQKVMVVVFVKPRVELKQRKFH